MCQMILKGIISHNEIAGSHSIWFYWHFIKNNKFYICAAWKDSISDDVTRVLLLYNIIIYYCTIIDYFTEWKIPIIACWVRPADVVIQMESESQ